MNLKTTLSLMLVLVVLVMGLYIVRSSPRADENADLGASPSSPSAAEQDLLEDGVGDVVKVVCRRKDEEEWVFEKIEPDDESDPIWHMIAPQQFKAVSWEVDKFERQLGALTYQISHEPGQPGAVTADEAACNFYISVDETQRDRRSEPTEKDPTINPMIINQIIINRR